MKKEDGGVFLMSLVIYIVLIPKRKQSKLLEVRCQYPKFGNKIVLRKLERIKTKTI